MFSWKEFEKTKVILSHFGGNHYRSEWGQHNVDVRPGVLLEWVEFLKEDLGFFTLTEIAALVTEEKAEVVYHLLNMGSHQRLNLHLGFEKGELIPSLEGFFPNAGWMEREQEEIFSVGFDRKKQGLILPEGKTESRPALPELRYNPNKSEAPYPEESYVWKDFDIYAPETCGHLEFQLCFDPVKLVDANVRIGYHHQGIEQLLQGKDLIQILQLVDKLNLSAAPNLSVAWAKTIEEMFRIRIPERAQAIRIIALELARIADHLTVIADICMKLQLDDFRLFINAREKVYELFEKFTGHRHGLGCAKIGGVSEDLPPGWIVEYQAVADVLSKNLKVIHQSLAGNQRFRNLLNGDALSAQAVLQWGITGPAMRAAGLNFDLRKSQPFYFYQDIDFDIPVGIFGTGYDRYLIRLEEIFQSLRIITQVIDNLPLGEFLSPLYSKNYLEVIQVFETLESPVEWHYSAVEAANGETGFLVRFEGGFKPQRLKIKTPSFSLAQGLPSLLKGLQHEQIAANFASLGISRWEMDR